MVFSIIHASDKGPEYILQPQYVESIKFLPNDPQCYYAGLYNVIKVMCRLVPAHKRRTVANPWCLDPYTTGQGGNMCALGCVSTKTSVHGAMGLLTPGNLRC